MNEQLGKKIEGPLENLRDIFAHVEETLKSSLWSKGITHSRGVEGSRSPDRGKRKVQEVEDLRKVFLRNLESIRDLCNNSTLATYLNSPVRPDRHKSPVPTLDPLGKDLKDLNASLGRNVLKLAEINHNCERAFFRWRDESNQATRSRELLSQEIEAFLESIHNKLLSKSSTLYVTRHSSLTRGHL